MLVLEPKGVGTDCAQIAALKDEANASAQKYEEELQVLVADKNALNDQVWN